MKRDIHQLTTRTFDVLVVGGGIYGLTIACDSAQRGLSVALIERNDFGSGASFNHLRTIHGGLRYLQTLDLARARESILERRTLARIAPSAVRPIPFVLPLSRSLARGKLAMRAGFLLDRVLARDRNDGVSPGHQLPPGQVISREQAFARYPPLRGVDLSGAAVWYDYVTTDADRLTLSWGLAAAAHGAVLANYVEARTLIVDNNRTVGVHAADRRDGRTLEISARVTINATGAALDILLERLGESTALSRLKAMNLVTTLEAGDEAIGGRGRTGRNLFMVPCRGRALFGTWETSHRSSPDDLAVKDAELSEFIRELNQAFPSLDLRRDDISLIHRGVVPAVVNSDGSLGLDGHERVRDHASTIREIGGLISVAGAKYTTARAVAERITNSIVAKLKRDAGPCRTATEPLPLSPLTDDALLIHAAREEMVVTLADAVIRRTPLGAMGNPGEAASRRAADIVGNELGWDEARKEAELDDLRRFYVI
jgi:glycerol-3-phosphate dehydrogenase